jgi:hypothetical protein
VRKRCAECGAEYEPYRLVCLECMEVLEDNAYLRFVVWTTVLAAGLQLGLRYFGVTSGRFIAEVFMTEVFLLVVACPVWKALQKIREPGRPVLAEMASVLGDRWMRAGLLVVIALFLYRLPAIAASFAELLESPQALWASGPYAAFARVRILVVMSIGSLVFIGAVIHQGWRFFDFRIENNCLLREYSRVMDSNPSVVVRHDAERDPNPAGEDDLLIEEFSEFMEKEVGPIDWVFHEVISDQVHIDVHHIPPTDERMVHVLFTTGMSQKPMNAPPEAVDCSHAELVVFLPPWWPIGETEFDDENNYWPIRNLKAIARLPHTYDSWVWFGHSIPNGDPPGPFADNTEFCCTMLSYPVLLGDDVGPCQLSDGRKVHLFCLVPLHEGEMQFKLKHGAEKLLLKLYEEHVPEIIDPERPSVV